MSKLLIDEEPLQVLPSLAVAIGLNEAIFLQQVHYWLKRSKHLHDGRQWIYNTVEEWLKQFPFWSDKTIRRIVNTLRKSGLLITTDEYNKRSFDNTLWYAIDYDKLNELECASGQVDQSIRSDCPDDVVNLTRPIPREYLQENIPSDLKDHDDDDRTRTRDRGKVIEAYHQNIGIITPLIGEQLNDLVDEVGHISVQAGILAAVQQSKRSYSYVQTCARNHANGVEKPAPKSRAPSGGDYPTQHRSTNRGLNAATEYMRKKGMLPDERNREG